MEPLTHVGPYRVGRIDGQTVAEHPRLVGPVVIAERALEGWIARQIRASLVIPELAAPKSEATPAAEAKAAAL